MRPTSLLPVSSGSSWIRLSAAQTRVERGCPHRPVALRQRGEESLRFLGGGDPLSSAPDRREPEVRARVHRDVAVLDGSTKDHAQGHQGVADRRRVAPLGKEVVREPLNVAVLNVGEARPTEARDDVVAQRRPVASGSRSACRGRPSDCGRGPTSCLRRARRGLPGWPCWPARARCPGERRSGSLSATLALPRASGRCSGCASTLDDSKRSPGSSAGSCRAAIARRASLLVPHLDARQPAP
jgi:hypothetical protein